MPSYTLIHVPGCDLERASAHVARSALATAVCLIIIAAAALLLQTYHEPVECDEIYMSFLHVPKHGGRSVVASFQRDDAFATRDRHRYYKSLQVLLNGSMASFFFDSPTHNQPHFTITSGHHSISNLKKLERPYAAKCILGIGRHMGPW